MDSDEFRDAAFKSIEHIKSYYDNISDIQVKSQVEPGYLRKLLPSKAPQEPETWDSIHSDIKDKIMPGLSHWQSPNFMAFFPCNSSFPGILGELYSAAFSAPGFNWICSPAMTELETIVLDWLADAFALAPCFKSDSEGGGVIQGSASEAIVTTMVAARDRMLRFMTKDITDEKEREDAFYGQRGQLVALGSEMAHSSTQKAAQICGVRFRSVPAPRSTGFTMTGDALQKVLEQCKADGLIPFFLTATLGTTATCAIDDFEGIARTLEDAPQVWVHVDAAYAGAALILPEHQHHASHFAAFDSVDINMHKWLLTNFDASVLFVKKRKDLFDALSITPSYLRNPHSESGAVTDYRDWQIPLGRRFRSLKIWFVLRTYGIRGLQGYLRNHIRFGETFASWMNEREDLFEVIAGPAFALNVFAVRPVSQTSTQQQDPVEKIAGDKQVEQIGALSIQEQGEAEATSAAEQDRTESNRLTKELYESVDTEGEFMLTSSVVGGAYVIRVVGANQNTTEKGLRSLFERLVRGVEEVRSRD